MRGSINEAREEYFGLGPVEGGDDLMKPTTMQSATESAPEADPSAPKPDDDEDQSKGKKVIDGRRKFADVTFHPLRKVA
jgi:hypothetical protein